MKQIAGRKKKGRAGKLRSWIDLANDGVPVSKAEIRGFGFWGKEGFADGPSDNYHLLNADCDAAHKIPVKGKSLKDWFRTS